MTAPPFEDFVSSHGDALLKLATVLTADVATAQDVVQSALERAFRDWYRISAMDRPEAYVRRMVTNEAISTRRRARRIVLTDHVPEVGGEAGPAESGELISALRRLPPRQRAAIALRYYFDLSDAQIADQLGCRETTVRGYVFRGLRALRVELDPAERKEDQ